MKQPRFIPWENKIFTEQLPAGVEYTFHSTPNARLLACMGGKTVLMANGAGTHCYSVQNTAHGIDVVILNWPEHCGPRPSTNPTWEEIKDNAPRPDAELRFRQPNGNEYTSLTKVNELTGLYIKPDNEFLGYVVWE